MKIGCHSLNYFETVQKTSKLTKIQIGQFTSFLDVFSVQDNNTGEQIKKKKMLSGIFHLIPLY